MNHAVGRATPWAVLCLCLMGCAESDVYYYGYWLFMLLMLLWGAITLWHSLWDKR